MITPDVGLQIGINLVALVMGYARLKTEIAVIQTELRYIKTRLKMPVESMPN